MERQTLFTAWKLECTLDVFGKDPEIWPEKFALRLPQSGCKWWEPSSAAVKNTEHGVKHFSIPHRTSLFSEYGVRHPSKLPNKPP